MIPRDRVLTALEHKEPDRVPIDLGSAVATGIHKDVYTELLKLLGIEEEIHIWDQISQVVKVSETVLELVGSDVRGVILKGVKGSSRVLDENKLLDEWGTVHQKPPNSHCYTPVEFPLTNAELKDLEAYPWPDGKNPERVEAAVDELRRIREQTDYAAIGMVSWIPLLRCQYLMGFDTFLENLYLKPEVVEELIERISTYQTDLAISFLEKADPYLDVVGLGDDFSTQLGPLINPRMWRQFFKPRLKKYLETIREKTKAKIWFHSCGSVYWVIRDLIECGVDILNPVQVMARDMDTGRLKQEFGQHLSFWGAIDTQGVLPQGNQADVESEVKKRISDLARGGGYILASCHSIEPGVPAENVLAMFQAARRWGEYPLCD